MWSLMELKEDPLFRHINQEDYHSYVMPAISDGRKKAETVNRETIYRVLREHKAMPEMVNTGNPLLVHSETLFEGGRTRIVIYEEVLRKIFLALESKGITMDFEELVFPHTAHEFYHCLEYWNGEDISRKCPAVDYRFLGVLPRKGLVQRTREIGAHAFAKEVCRLDFHPKLLDYLLWEREDEEFSDTYFKECMEMREMMMGDLKWQ